LLGTAVASERRHVCVKSTGGNCQALREVLDLEFSVRLLQNIYGRLRAERCPELKGFQLLELFSTLLLMFASGKLDALRAKYWVQNTLASQRFSQISLVPLPKS
jgi:hypothetical protein